MHSPNTTSQNRFSHQLRYPSALRQWLEDLLSITLIVIVVSSLVLATTLYLDSTKPGSESAHITRDEGGTVPAIYKRHAQKHSIDI
jgi:hypothetical protein